MNGTEAAQRQLLNKQWMAAFESFECVNTEEADSFIAYLSDTISLLSSSLVMAVAFPKVGTRTG